MLADVIPPPAARRYAAIALTLLAHALLVLGWQHARRLPPADRDDSERIAWVNVAPRAPLTVPPPPSRPAAARVASAVATMRPRAPTGTPAAPAQPPGEVAPVLPAPALEAPTPSAAEILRQARGSIGKIDQQLRKAYPGQPITAPVSNGATRLAQGLQAAADAAPNRWYEAPKVSEIIDPGPYARRRYRVVGANGTYCITVESNHAPDGLDIAKGIEQKKTNCEASEQAATKQAW